MGYVGNEGTISLSLLFYNTIIGNIYLTIFNRHGMIGRGWQIFMRRTNDEDHDCVAISCKVSDPVKVLQKRHLTLLFNSNL